MKKLLVLFLFFICISSYSQRNPFIGQWFWSTNGQVVTADRNEFKIFTEDGFFISMVKEKGSWIQEDKIKYSFNEKECTISFNRNNKMYKFKYIIDDEKNIRFLDLEIQENPTIYCFKFSN